MALMFLIMLALIPVFLVVFAVAIGATGGSVFMIIRGMKKKNTALQVGGWVLASLSTVALLVVAVMATYNVYCIVELIEAYP